MLNLHKCGELDGGFVVSILATRGTFLFSIFLTTRGIHYTVRFLVIHCAPDISRSLFCVYTVNPTKYAHGFVVLCFVVVMQSFIMNSHEVFILIHQGCFAGTGAIVSKPDGYGKISQCITTTKHSKAKTVCIFLGIYCIVKDKIRARHAVSFARANLTEVFVVVIIVHCALLYKM